MSIEEGKELRLENLLSLRKMMTQEEMNEEMMKIGKLFKEVGVKKNGSIVTATFAIESVGGQPLMDIEILVPMDKKVDLPSEYRVKDLFHIVNAVYARHEGNPAMLQNTYNEMMPGMSADEMVIDVYIGVNPSVL